MIFDSCSWHVPRMLDDQEPVRYHIVGHGDIKAVSFKEKNQANPTKSGNKISSVSKAESV